MRTALTAVGATLAPAAIVLLVLALRDPSPNRAAVLAAVGAAAMTLGVLALGLAALSRIGLPPVQRGVGEPPPAAAALTLAVASGSADRQASDQKILDTNVLIDGRIADLCETGFLGGTLIIPQFVLRELHYIADSSDPLKRNRGRRGLDVLARMQKRSDPAIIITDQDFSLVREVDAKLVALARETGARIITNDFNLNKVAEVNGVQVLNINQLANALKPVVLPGEMMRVAILKEGKEINQGVAYLEDGTMVVVDNARRFIGRNLEVTVTSAIQTTAGRMIFAQLKEAPRDQPPGSAEPAS